MILIFCFKIFAAACQHKVQKQCHKATSYTKTKFGYDARAMYFSGYNMPVILSMIMACCLLLLRDGKRRPLASIFRLGRWQWHLMIYSNSSISPSRFACWTMIFLLPCLRQLIWWWSCWGPILGRLSTRWGKQRVHDWYLAILILSRISKNLGVALGSRFDCIKSK